ncbi:hypothetical protein GTA08_BOTSDO04914 [Botryosphaeria dothidea]|uniref:Uncharacterized protein n=1 Tax=Botryosphaeria dothidea TaxID=55169 RepID=A0A8H4IS24_9PEZI|nr:hypothetical protein GTA08_BOTSDO04914 [Botryosphaeria dothidea]
MGSDDRISWLAALVVDQGSFDSVSVARASIWAVVPNMNADGMREDELEQHCYTGHFKMLLRMLAEFCRVIFDPEDDEMFNGWSLAPDTPWPNWRWREIHE